jgi:DNA-binding transcriptional MerR regulator
VRIGELAARAGVSVRSLRYYEEQGLLASTRTAGGQRWYAEVDVERVVLVQRLYAAGLSSSTIATLMPCVDTPSEAASVAALARMAEERERLDAHIADLHRIRATLDEVMQSARAHLDGQRAAGSPNSAKCESPRNDVSPAIRPSRTSRAVIDQPRNSPEASR